MIEQPGKGEQGDEVDQGCSSQSTRKDWHPETEVNLTLEQSGKGEEGSKKVRGCFSQDQRRR